MARHSSAHQLKFKDYFILGLHKVMTEKIEKVLRKVLLWGTPRRNPNQTFCEYLLTVKKISGAEYRKGFNKSQRDKMESYLQVDSYDVSLLYQCIQYGCDGLAPPKDPRWWESRDTLEHQLTSVKNHRNDFMHKAYEINKQNYLDKIEEIRSLLNNIIQKAAKHFSRSDTEMKQLLKGINDELNQIRDQPFNAFASAHIYDKLTILFKMEGRTELQKQYKAESSMSPISNLLGRQILVNVKTIFTRIEIHRVNNYEVLSVDRLFEYVDLLSSRKNVLLVEGVAGAGKTTLIRMILQEWSERSSKMKNLDNYDLAIWTECRDSGTPSLVQLLHSLMPLATRKIQGDAQVVKCIQKNELLFLVDGLDELNASSERVFREILALKDANIITIICTTRPNKAPDIKRYVPDTFEILHVKIDGIAEEDREDFVGNYTQALESQVGTINTSSLLHYLKRKDCRLQEHWRLPFNLVLVTLLWLQNQNIFNDMTTATELFLKTYELCKERLILRLHDNEETSRLSSNDIQEKVTLFLKVMINIAFNSHYDDETVLSQTSIEYLRDTCKSQNLPHGEVIGAFLVQTASLIDGNLEKISFPHKGLQDFFCALHIEEALNHEDADLDIPRMISSFEQLLLENKVSKARIPSLLQEYNSKFQAEASNKCPTVQSVFRQALQGVAIRNPNQEVELDLRKWKNVLMHLTGLLHHRGRSLTDERAEEMVKLLEESGITDSNEWFEFLSNVKCDAAFSRHIVLRGDIEVTDARVEAFLRLLDHAEPGEVEIGIEADPSATPRLEELLVALRNKRWAVNLFLHHDFRFPKEGGSAFDGTLRNLFWSNPRLKMFIGQLSASALKELPSSVFDLRLSVKDGVHFRSLLPVLNTWVEKRSALTENLTSLWIHVPVDIDESSLRPLPRGPDLRLVVSGVGEATAERASVVARALQPSSGRFWRIYFPGVGRTPTACERLLEELGRRGVEVGGEFSGVSVSPVVGEGEEQRLKDLARRKVLSRFYSMSDRKMWNLL